MPATSAGAVGEWQSGAKVTFGLLKFTPLAQFGKLPTSPSPEKGILSLKLTNARFQVVGPS